jgi:hypothetical protein
VQVNDEPDGRGDAAPAEPPLVPAPPPPSSASTDIAVDLTDPGVAGPVVVTVPAMQTSFGHQRIAAIDVCNLTRATLELFRQAVTQEGELQPMRGLCGLGEQGPVVTGRAEIAVMLKRDAERLRTVVENRLRHPPELSQAEIRLDRTLGHPFRRWAAVHVQLADFILVPIRRGALVQAEARRRDRLARRREERARVTTLGVTATRPAKREKLPPKPKCVKCRKRPAQAHELLCSACAMWEGRRT